MSRPQPDFDFGATDSDAIHETLAEHRSLAERLREQLKPLSRAIEQAVFGWPSDTPYTEVQPRANGGLLFTYPCWDGGDDAFLYIAIEADEVRQPEDAFCRLRWRFPLRCPECLDGRYEWDALGCPACTEELAFVLADEEERGEGVLAALLEWGAGSVEGPKVVEALESLDARAVANLPDGTVQTLLRHPDRPVRLKVQTFLPSRNAVGERDRARDPESGLAR